MSILALLACARSPTYIYTLPHVDAGVDTSHAVSLLKSLVVSTLYSHIFWGWGSCAAWRLQVNCMSGVQLHRPFQS
jgi:hypothetical protein